MSSTAKSRGLLLGTLIGGAIGAVSAFLLAPKSGVKLRKDIATKYRVINDKMQKMVAAAGEKTHDFEDKIVDKTIEVKNNVINAWQDSKEEVKREADRKHQPFSDYK